MMRPNKKNFYGMPWRVTAVRTLPDYRLELDFIDGSRKIYDMKPQLYGALEPLKDTALFGKARVFMSTVVWTDKIDIAPEELYANGIPCESAPTVAEEFV